MKAASVAVGSAGVSTKIADLPGASEVTPFSATAVANDGALSSIFHPVRSTVVVPVLVSSHQSALYVALLLVNGETSVIATLGG